MKQVYYVFLLIGVCFILLAACLKPVFDGGQYILIEKRVGEENKYDNFKKVTAQKEVKQVRAILRSADWEKAKVEMESPPDYLFFFQYKNPNIEAKAVLYELWITPNGDQVELVENNSYVKLDQGMSTEMIELLIGEK